MPQITQPDQLFDNVPVSHAQELGSSVISNLQNQLQTDQLKISQMKKQLPLSPQKVVEESSANLSKIWKQKKQLAEQLARLQYQEKQCKNSSKPTLNSHFRSHITSEEKKKISQIIRKEKQFEAQLMSKSKAHEEQLNHYYLEEKETHRRSREKEAQKHHGEALKNIEDIQKRKHERAKSLSQLNKQYQKIKSTKCLHDEVAEKWQAAKRQRRHEDQAAIDQRKKSKGFNIQQIKQHSKKYETIINSQKLERQQKNNQFRTHLVEREGTQYPRSLFFNTLTEEENLRMKKEQEKTQAYQTFIQKRMSYSQGIRQNYKPTIAKPLKKEAVKSIRSSSSIQIYQRGNQYMKKVHSNIINTHPHTQELVQEPLRRTPDYLTQARLKRSRDRINPQKAREIEEIEYVLQSKQTQSYKLEKAKILANKLEAKADSTNTPMLISTIQAKLQIIEQFIQ